MTPAVQLVQLVSENAQEATAHSWQRLNAALDDAVTLAIEAGLRFDDSSVQVIVGLRRGRWVGADAIERWYARAVKYGNTSACRAIESYRERKPFPDPQGSGRLAVGSQFHFDYAHLRVTSFNDEKGTLHAIEYSDPDDRDILSHHDLTPKQLRDFQKQWKAMTDDERRGWEAEWRRRFEERRTKQLGRRALANLKETP